MVGSGSNRLGRGQGDSGSRSRQGWEVKLTGVKRKTPGLGQRNRKYNASELTKSGTDSSVYLAYA